MLLPVKVCLCELAAPSASKFACESGHDGVLQLSFVEAIFLEAAAN